MCCGPYDYEYPMLENTRYPRTDPEYGRVGSIFSDPNISSSGAIPKTNADVPIDDKRREEIEGETDDPNFNLDSDPDSTGDPFNNEFPDDDVDTSASFSSPEGWR